MLDVGAAEVWANTGVTTPTIKSAANKGENKFLVMTESFLEGELGRQVVAGLLAVGSDAGHDAAQIYIRQGD